MNDSLGQRPGPPPIGGWLLVLCALLLVWQPVSLGLTASQALDALAVRGLPLALLLAGRVLAAGLGIAAGLSIFRHASSAIAMAKAALVSSAALDVFVYLTPYFPNNRAPGDTPIYVAAALTYYCVWLIYLTRSRRVRATFPTN